MGATATGMVIATAGRDTATAIGGIDVDTTITITGSGTKGEGTVTGITITGAGTRAEGTVTVTTIMMTPTTSATAGTDTGIDIGPIRGINTTARDPTIGTHNPGRETGEAPREEETGA
jgi:hypothetical protein